MSRTVVEIHPGPEGQGLMVSLGESPEVIPAGWQIHPFYYNQSDPIPEGFRNGSASVSDMGAYLMEKLNLHPGVKQALDSLLTTAVGSARSLYLQVSPDAEGVPWETLFANNSFLALDPRWPIARMGVENTSVTRVRDFDPPLRMMAVLAAAGIDAAPEWGALDSVLEQAPFPVRLKVLVAQDELHQRISQVARPNLELEVGLVPPGRELLQQIADFRPNLLHFFCHGTVGANFPMMRIATRSSWDAPGDPAEVVIESSGFPVETTRDSLWIVTVNACRGAEVVEGVGSLVYSLVEQGVAAVAGMREPVADVDANAFCRGFYRALIQLLGPAAAQPNLEMEIDLARALYEPRMEICEGHRGEAPCLDAATKSKEWTLPVLYVRGNFVVRGRSGAPQVDPETRARNEAELQVLRDLEQQMLNAPPEVLARYRRRVQELEKSMYG